MAADTIITYWEQRKYKPLYWLEGDEPFFIDEIVDYAENKLLPESERGFNLMVFYGKDADWTQVVNSARRYPMFAERQVVILKEAQQMRDLDKLEAYFENPAPSTVFIVAYKGKKLDGRTKMAKLIKSKGELLSTRKLYDNELPGWLSDLAKGKGYSLTPKALFLLIDHLGNDLGRINNELDKVAINLSDSKEINESDIETYVGISKEYNAFELQKALAQRNLSQCIQILNYFESAPKAVPLQQLLPTLYSFFSKCYLVFGANTNNEFELAKYLGYQSLNPYVKDIIVCTKNYRQKGVEQALLLLHEYNLKSIGVHSAPVGDAELLKEMVVKMMVQE